MNNEIKEMTKVLKSLGNKQASELYYYITNLQQENERLKEELNGKQLREIHKINNYDYFKEMTNNWNREDFSRRCYDLCNEKVDLQQRIKKAVEYIEEHRRVYKLGVNQEIDEFEYISTSPQVLLDILNGRSDE